jgi:hypothetical protein
MIGFAVDDMQSLVMHDSWMAQYPREIDRNNDDCRQIFVDDYAEKYADLPELYDEINQLGQKSFYYKGLPGKEFDLFGPPVDIGTIDEPYIPTHPNTPAARKEWEQKPALLDKKKIEEGGEMIFKAEICGQEVQLLHIGSGLAVRIEEHQLIQKLMNEQISAEPAGTVKGGANKCLKAAIYHNLIRMFWPGYSHKVFSDPRNISKPKEKPAFHLKRLTLAAEYAGLVWSQVLKELRPQLKKRTDYASPSAKHNDKIDWKEEITKCFVKLKAVAQQQHACDMGFGYNWYKKNFSSKDESEANKTPRKKIEFFGKYQPKAPTTPALPAALPDEEDGE